MFADRNILVREKISEMLQILSNNEFIQVHKSFVISKKHIDKIEGNRINIGSFTIPISKTYKKHVIKLIK
ncbi:LytTR family DNA-binding domain-containing protein [Lacinutrix neustonica]|uniref:LytTR family DNA-binding domain-containing protein n=1 Tax=Lacinutrix neustonica TaxID=2980107 RepID=A0A9E8N163_9FLAO|nr:LytTR family DNA-binding domain-containing protein [Lacinutrix neustonica]WAC03930.1 LytTR family DNA-binding domain-containing protein [Lacinutrix neustonica]